MNKDCAFVIAMPSNETKNTHNKSEYVLLASSAKKCMYEKPIGIQ